MAVWRRRRAYKVPLMVDIDRKLRPLFEFMLSGSMASMRRQNEYMDDSLVTESDDFLDYMTVTAIVE